jgi:hypothetical protein
MIRVSPYKSLAPELDNQAALVTLTYSQLQATANVLFNLYMLLEATDDLSRKVYADALKSMEVTMQSVHDSLVNCSLSLEAAHKAGG